MRNVIRFIEEVFGEGPGPDLIAAIPDMPVARIGAFVDLYMEHAKRFDSAELQLPPKTLSHCRPVLATDEVFPELNPHKDSFDPQSIAVNALSRIQQSLLYCHSLAVVDPFMDLPKRGKFPIEVVRQWFASYVSFLSMAKPLIEDELLLILPISFEPTAIFSIEESLNVGKQIFPGADFEDFRRVEHEFFGSFLLSLALLRLTQTLQAQLFFDHFLDVYLPYSYYEPALGRLIEEVEHNWTFKATDKDKLGAMDDFATRRLRRLATLEIPSWENFEVSDLISIRQGEGFQAWRSNLGRAIDELFLNGVTNEAEAQRFLNESLAEARVIVSKETSTSRFMNDRRAALKSFGIGGSSALLLSPFLDVRKTLLLSGTQTAISLAVARLLSKRTDPGDNALRRHYLLFNP